MVEKLTSPTTHQLRVYRSGQPKRNRPSTQKRHILHSDRMVVSRKKKPEHRDWIWIRYSAAMDVRRLIICGMGSWLPASSAQQTTVTRKKFYVSSWSLTQVCYHKKVKWFWPWYSNGSSSRIRNGEADEKVDVDQELMYFYRGKFGVATQSSNFHHYGIFGNQRSDMLSLAWVKQNISLKQNYSSQHVLWRSKTLRYPGKATTCSRHRTTLSTAAKRRSTMSAKMRCCGQRLRFLGQAFRRNCPSKLQQTLQKSLIILYKKWLSRYLPDTSHNLVDIFELTSFQGPSTGLYARTRPPYHASFSVRFCRTLRLPTMMTKPTLGSLVGF